MGNYHCSSVSVLNSTCAAQQNSSFNATEHDTTHISRNSDSFETAFQLYIACFLCVIGLLGNALTVVVLRKDPLRRDALLLLQALAVADAGYVVVAFLRYPLEHLLSRAAYASMQPLVLPLLTTFQTSTIWMLVGVTVDRYAHVCWPLHAQGYFSSTRRKLLAATLFFAAALYNLPNFLAGCVMRVYDPCQRHMYVTMTYRASFNNDLYFYFYICIVHLICLYLVPLSALAFMNVSLLRSIQHSRRFQRNNSSSSQREYSDTNATMVLVIIIVVFVICQSPVLLINVVTIAERNVDQRVIHTVAFQRFHVISETLLILNSTVNFFIYVAFGRRFRYIMKETFRYLAYSNATLLTHETAPLQNVKHDNAHRFA